MRYSILLVLALFFGFALVGRAEECKKKPAPVQPTPPPMMVCLMPMHRPVMRVVQFCCEREPVRHIVQCLRCPCRRRR